MTELKPCPFCGGKAHLNFIQIDEPVTNFDMYYQIGCNHCHILMRYTIRTLMDKAEHEKAKRSLSEAWNRRAEVK